MDIAEARLVLVQRAHQAVVEHQAQEVALQAVVEHQAQGVVLQRAQAVPLALLVVLHPLEQVEVLLVALLVLAVAINPLVVQPLVLDMVEVVHRNQAQVPLLIIRHLQKVKQ